MYEDAVYMLIPVFGCNFLFRLQVPWPVPEKAG